MKASTVCTLPRAVRRSAEKPLWYLTSPEPLTRLEVVGALELGEQLRRRLAEQIDEHVEAAAMRHADDHLLDAGVARALDQIIERAG